MDKDTPPHVRNASDSLIRPAYVDDDGPIRVQKRSLPAGENLYPTTVQHQGKAVQLTARRGSGTRGVHYKYYEKSESGYWSDFPDFDELTPVRTGVVDSLALETVAHRRKKKRGLKTSFAIQFHGYLTVPADGEYEFGFNSDDKTRLVIGGEEILVHEKKNSGWDHWTTESIELRAGRHPFKLEYYQAWGQKWIKHRWRGPGFGWQNISSYVLTPRSPGERPETILDLGLDDSSAVHNGLDYETFKNDEKLPTRTGSLPVPELRRIGWKGGEEPQKVCFTGLLEISHHGTYEFKQETDVEWASVYVNGKDVTDGSIELDAGFCPVEIQYGLKNPKHPTAMLKWKPPDGSSYSPIPPDAFYRFAPQMTFESGLDYEYFESSNPPSSEDAISEFIRTNEPLKRGTVPSLTVDEVDHRPEYYVVRFHGYIYVPRPGKWTFTTMSDDHNRVVVNGEVVVSNIGYGTGWKYGSMDLDRGLHFFAVEFVNEPRNEWIKLEWKCDDGSFSPVGPDHLYRNTTGEGYEYYYSVLETESADRKENTNGSGPSPSAGTARVDHSEWGNFQQLPIPSEVTPAGSSLATLERSPATEPGVRVVSDGKYLHVLMAGIASIYVSTYVLRTNTDTQGSNRFELRPARQVRFERSESPDVPDSDDDTQGTENRDGIPFEHPVFELPLGEHLNGPLNPQPEFEVELVDAKGDGEKRWLLYVANTDSSRLFCYSIPQAKDGPFDLRDMVDDGYVEPDRVLTITNANDEDHRGVQYETYTHEHRAKHYDKRSRFIERFRSDEPVESGTMDNFGVPPDLPHNAGVLFTALLDIPETGTYEFATDSDDSSRVLIDGTEIASSMGYNAGSDSGTMFLEKGQHDITVQFADSHPTKADLSVEWKQPSAPAHADLSEIPSEYLSLDGIRPTGGPATTIYSDREHAFSKDGDPLDVKVSSNLKLLIPVEGAVNGTVDIDCSLGADGVPACLGPPASARERCSRDDLYKQIQPRTIEVGRRCVELTERGVIDIEQNECPQSNEFRQRISIFGTADSGETCDVWGTYDPSNHSAPPCISIIDKRRLRVGFGTGDDYVCFDTDENVLARSGWNEIAVTFDGTTYKVKVGAITVLEESVSATPETVLPKQLGSGYRGKLADALLMTTGSKAVSQWLMTDGDGTEIDDSAGPNTGTLSGGRWVPYSRPPEPVKSDPQGTATTYVDQRGLVLQAGIMNPGKSYHPGPDGPKESDFGNVARGSRPVLFDGSDSLIHAYYRTPDGEFMGTQFDPAIRRNVYRVRWTAGKGDDEGYAYFVGKQPIPARHAAVNVFGGQNSTIKLELKNGLPHDNEVKEVWEGVPNQVSEIVSILSGDAIPDPMAPPLQTGNGVFYDYSGERRVGLFTVSNIDGEKLVFAARNKATSERARLVPKHIELQSGEAATFTVEFEGISSDDGTKDGTVSLELTNVPTEIDDLGRHARNGSDYRNLYATFVDVINGRADEETYNYDENASFKNGELYSLPAGPGELPLAIIGTTAETLSITDGNDPLTCNFEVVLENGKSHSWDNVSRCPSEFIDAITRCENVLENLVFGEIPARESGEQPKRLKNVTGDDARTPRALADFYECINDTGDLDPDIAARNPSIPDFSIEMKCRQGVTTTADLRLYTRSSMTAEDVFKTSGSELYSFVQPDKPNVPYPAILSETKSFIRRISGGMNGYWMPPSTRSSLSFDGGDALTISDSKELTEAGNLTIEAWANISNSDLDSRNPIVSARPSKDRGLRANDYVFGIGKDKRLVGEFNGRQHSSEKLEDLDGWHHVAGVYESAHGVSLHGEEFADCGGGASLQFKDELTLVARVQVRKDETPNGVLLSKLNPAGDAGYELSVESTRQGDDIVMKPTVTIWIEGDKIGTHEVKKRIPTVREKIVLEETDKYQAGSPLTITALFRVYSINRNGNHTEMPVCVVAMTQGMNQTVNVKTAGKWRSVEIATSKTPVTIGARKTRQSGHESGKPGTINRFTGVLSDVALWPEMLPPDRLATIEQRGITEVKEQPSALWRFEEQTGHTASDIIGGNDAQFVATGQRELIEENLWTPFPGRASFYVDGVRIPNYETTTPDITRKTPWTEGRIASGWDTTLKGNLDDVRVWNEVRTVGEIAINRHRKLTGNERSLGAYWPLDQVSGDAAADVSGYGHDALLPRTGSKPTWDDPAPISTEAKGIGNALGVESTITIEQAPTVVEYANTHRTQSGRVIGLLNRAYIYVIKDELESVPGFPVGTLEPKYIGQVQTEPTLVGFIEGPPPLPSENLTRPFYRSPTGGPYLSYDGSSSVSFTKSESTSIGLSGSREVQQLAGMEFGAGLLAGGDVQVGIPGALSTIKKYDVKAGLTVGIDFDTAKSEGRALSAGQTTTTTNEFSNGGDWERGTPYLAKPNDDVESPVRRYVPDNEGYALVKSRTADLYAFYLQETGSMVATQALPDPDIPEDVNLIYFPMDPQYVKNGTLDGRVGTRRDPDYRNVNVQRGSYFKPVEAYDLEAEVERQNERLRGYYAEAFGGSPLAINPFTRPFDDDDGHPTVGGSESLNFDWAQEYGKRDIADTYVWTTAGGLYAEEQSISAQLEESFGVTSQISYDVEIGGEAMAKLAHFGAFVQSSFSLGWQFSTTLAKTSTDGVGFGLHVHADPDGYLNEYQPEEDYWSGKGKKAVPYTDTAVPGKVDSYRFKSFYLSPQEKHSRTFFDQVVDSNWLEHSTSPRAGALRTAMTHSHGEPVWRVLHRTTHVSRVPSTAEGIGEQSGATGITEPINQPQNELLIQLVEARLPTEEIPSKGTLSRAIEEVLYKDLSGVIPWWSRFLELAETPNSKGSDQLDSVIESVTAYIWQLYRARAEKGQ